MSALYQYVVLHTSTRNHPGVLACQAAHAAHDAFQAVFDDATCRQVDPPQWMCEGQKPNVVALEADTAEDLEALSKELTEAGIPHALVREPDPPYHMSATAVGTAPLNCSQRDIVRPITRRFRLLR